MNKQIFEKLSYGMYVLTSSIDSKLFGCIINSAMQITDEQPTIMVSVNQKSLTHNCIKQSKKFSIQIIGENTELSIISIFGYKSSFNTNKFESFDYQLIDSLPILNHTIGYITCEVIEMLNIDSHTIFIGKVMNCECFRNDKAMTYQYFHEQVKKTLAKKDQWMCSVCGYVYDGIIPFENLQEDYICPICLQSKEVFVKM